MNEIISALAVNLLTSGSKRVMPVLGRVPKGYLRLGVAVLSFLAVLGSASLSGGEVDVLQVESFVKALEVFAISQGAYFLSK